MTYTMWWILGAVIWVLSLLFFIAMTMGAERINREVKRQQQLTMVKEGGRHRGR